MIYEKQNKVVYGISGGVLRLVPKDISQVLHLKLKGAFVKHRHQKPYSHPSHSSHPSHPSHPSHSSLLFHPFGSADYSLLFSSLSFSLSVGIKRKYTPLRLGIFLLLLFSVGSSFLHAYLVTSLDDSGPGTLREGMTLATSGDVITFSGSIVGGTISLQSSLPPIIYPITIEGAITINENGSWVAFNVNALPDMGNVPSILQVNIIEPINPDTQVSANTIFFADTSSLTNLDTFGETDLAFSSLNGVVTVESTGLLKLFFNSSITAPTTPVTINGTLLTTSGSSISGSLNVNGIANLNSTPVTGLVTVGSTGSLTDNSSALGALTTSGTSSLQGGVSVTGATIVPSGTLTVDHSTLSTLDTTGATTLQNGSVTGAAIVEVGGSLMATSSTLGSTLTDNGHATLTNTPVAGPVKVGSTGNFTGSGLTTVLNSLTTSGTSTLNSKASVIGATIVTSGSLTVDDATLSTLDTFGTTNLQDNAKVTGAIIVEAGGGLMAINALLSSTLLDNGTATLTDTPVPGLVTVGSKGIFNATASPLGNALIDNGVATLTNTPVAGLVTVGSKAIFNATASPLGSALIDNGTATLTNTPVAGNILINPTGIFTGSGAGTVLSSLISRGNTNLNTRASVTGALQVLEGSTEFQSGAFVVGPTTVSSGAFLSVTDATLNTLDTFGTTQFDSGGVASSAIVESIGRLTGIGDVIGTLTNQGLFSPGINGVGTFSSGTFLQQSKGTFEAIVTGNTTGLSSSETAAELNGSLFVNIPSTTCSFNVRQYTIIEAPSVTGTFSSITFSTPSLFNIAYFPTHVDIQVLPLATLCLTSNARSAADCLISDIHSPPHTDLAVIKQALFQLPTKDIQNIFNHIQPSQYSALTWVQMTNILNLQRSLSHHGSLWKQRRDLENFPYGCIAMPEESCWHEPFYCDMPPRRRRTLAPRSWRGWIDVVGNWQQQSGTNHQFGFHDSSGSVSVGVDGIYESVFLGLVGAYQTDQLSWEKGAGDSTMRTGYGGGYAMFANNLFFADLSCLVGYTTYHVNRKIHACSIRRTAFSKFNSWEGVVGMGVGTYRTLYGIEWIPHARLDYARISQKTFTEHHAKSLNLHLSPYNTSLFQLEVGVLFERAYCCEHEVFNGLFTPKINLSYIGQYPTEQDRLRARFQSIPTCHFSVKGWDFRRNLFAPTLTCTFFRAGSQFTLELGYAAQVGRDYWNNQGYLEMNWTF